MPEIVVPLIAILASVIGVVSVIVAFLVKQLSDFITESRTDRGKLQDEVDAQKKRIKTLEDQHDTDTEEKEKAISDLKAAQTELSDAKDTIEKQKTNHADEIASLKQTLQANYTASIELIRNSLANEYNKTVESIKSALAQEHAEDIRRLKESIGAEYEQKYAPLRQDFDTLKTKLSDKEAELTNEKAKNGVLQGQVEQMQGQIGTLEGQVFEAQQRIRELQAKVGTGNLTPPSDPPPTSETPSST